MNYKTKEGVASFMSAVSGLPSEVYLAWDEVDFSQTHGVDWRERIDRREAL